jgi:hypothetical protein
VHPHGLTDRLLAPSKGIIAETITLVDSPIEVGIDLRWSITRRCWRRRPRSGVSWSLAGGDPWLLGRVVQGPCDCRVVLHRQDSSGCTCPAEFAIMYF